MAFTGDRMVDLEDEILQQYCSPEVRDRIKQKVKDQAPLVSPQSVVYSPTSANSKASISDSAYRERTDSGQLEANLKDPGFVEFSDYPSFSFASAPIEVPKLLFSNRPDSIRDAINSRIEAAEDHLHGLAENGAFAHPLQGGQEPFVTVGMVLFEQVGTEPKPYLQCSNRVANGCRISLKLQDVSSFSLFSGQIVALRGRNIDGESISVLELLSLPSPTGLQSTEAGPAASIAIAAGPFSLDDSLEFLPLSDFLAYLRTKLRANQGSISAVFLAGPFLDCQHPFFMSGDVMQFPEELLRDLVFEKFLAPFCREFPWVSFFTVPSTREFGQAAQSVPRGPLLSGNEPANLKHLPNPATLFLSSTISMSLCSGDPLFQLSNAEVHRNPTLYPMDRMSRLCTLLYQQRHFFPAISRVNAPSPVGIEFSGYSSLSFPPLPSALNVFVLPSQLRPFVKRPVADAVFVNPGHLCRSKSGGTFASVQVSASGAVSARVIRL